MSQPNERGYFVTNNGDGTYSGNYCGECKVFLGRKAKENAHEWCKNRWLSSFIRREVDPVDDTVEILAKRWNVSQQRVGQIERNAMGKIREALLGDPALIGLLRELRIHTEDLQCFES